MKLLILDDKNLHEEDRGRFWIEQELNPERADVEGGTGVRCEDEACSKPGVWRMQEDRTTGPLWYYFCTDHMNEVLRNSDILEVSE